jgi:hypothetical protein
VRRAFPGADDFLEEDLRAARARLTLVPLDAAVGFFRAARRVFLADFAAFGLVFLGLLTTWRAFFAIVVTASPATVAALTAKSLVPSKPALAVSMTSVPVSTATSLAVVRIPSLSSSILIPPFFEVRLDLCFSRGSPQPRKEVFPLTCVLQPHTLDEDHWRTVPALLESGKKTARGAVCNGGQRFYRYRMIPICLDIFLGSASSSSSVSSSDSACVTRNSCSTFSVSQLCWNNAAELNPCRFAERKPGLLTPGFFFLERRQAVSRL